MILLKDRYGRILVAHKTNAPMNDWYLPSGGIEERENPQETFWRELNEELGFGPADVSAPRQSPITHKYTWNAGLIAKTGYEGQEQIIMIATVREGAIADLDRTGELDRIRWVSFDDIDKAIPHKDLLATIRRVHDTGLL